jgi:hypothetical protein
VFFDKDNVLVDLLCPAQVCTSSLSTVFMVEQVYVDEDLFSKQYWQDDIDDTKWLELFQPSTAVKNLYTSKKSLSCIATTLKDLSEERVTEVLPTLEMLAISIAIFLLTSP